MGSLRIIIPETFFLISEILDDKMRSIHKIVKVVNNQVDLPVEFADMELEVILKTVTHKDPRIRELEKEIDAGMLSPVSSISHEEIFDQLRKKYESSRA
jgi:hypothetical protein